MATQFKLSGGSPTAEAYASAWISSQTDTTATIVVRSYARLVYSSASVQSSGVYARAYGNGSWQNQQRIFGDCYPDKHSGNAWCYTDHYFTVNKGSGQTSAYWASEFHSWVDDTDLGSVVFNDGYVSVPAITYYEPNAPSGLTNTRESDSKNVLSWTAPNTSTTKPVSAILIERSVDGGAWSQIASVSASATSYNDATTSADHSYQYRICSQNSAGKSDYVTSQTTYNTPAAPTKVTASRLTETTVKLEIENPAHTAQGAQIERSTNGATWEWVANVQGAPVTETTDEPGGGAFFYRVRNTRDGQDGGMLVSGWSPVSNVVVTIREPAAPTLKSPVSGSVIKKSQETITFKWAHNPVDGSAQTAAELAYSTDGGNTWTTVSVTTAQQKSIANDFDINTQITWRVRTKGAHANYGPWSSTRVFRVYQEPSVAFTAPSDGFTIENTPIHVALQYDDPSGTLANASLSIAEGAKVVYTRDMGTDTTCDIQATEWLPDDGVEYTLTVYVRSSSSLTASAIRVVSVDFDLPTPAVLGITPDPETGYVSLLVDVPSRFSDASGDPVHVTDALEGAKVEELTVNGNSYQVVTTGKNLLPLLKNDGTYTRDGITYKINEDGSIKVSGTATATSYLVLNGAGSSLAVGDYEPFAFPSECVVTPLPAGVTLQSRLADSSYVPIYASQQKTGWQGVDVSVVYLNVASGVTVDATVYPQIEAGSTVTDYEPYSGGVASPCPDWPQPITMLGARNLLPYPYGQTTRTVAGVTWTDNGDGTITANGTATDNSSFGLILSSAPMALDSGSYVLSVFNNSVANADIRMDDYTGGSYVKAITGSVKTKKTFTLSEETEINCYLTVYSGETVSNLTFKPMLRPAACEDDEWVPYGKVKVEARGKNLLPLNTLASRTTNGITFTPSGNGLTVIGTATADVSFPLCSNSFTLEAGTYVLSANMEGKLSSGYGINIYMASSDGDVYLYKSGTLSGVSTRTFTLESARTFTRATLYCDAKATYDLSITDMQINADAVAEWVPHAEPLTALIDMQGYEVCALPDGTRDELTVDGEGNVSLVRNVGKVVFDGSEDEVWQPRETAEAYRFITYVNDIKAVANDNDMPVGICDRLQPKSRNQTWSDISGFSYGTGTGLYICVSSISTVEDFTAWLAENPVTLYYPLKTPKTVSLGTVELTDLPAPDFKMQAEASLPATLDLTYTNGMEPASSVSVYRSYDGERVLIAEGLQQGAGVVDRYAPLNVDYAYEAVTFADSGALNASGFDTRINTPWWFVYFAEGMAKAMWEPSGSRSSRRTKDELKERDGSKWPVLIQGKTLSHKVDFSGWVETKEEADAFEDMTLASGGKVYKGLKGEVFHCHAEADITDSYEYGDDSADVKVAITRVRGGAL